MAILNSLFRIKKIDNNHQSELSRCIGLFNLTALGIKLNSSSKLLNCFLIRF